MKILITGPRDCTAEAPIHALLATWMLMLGDGLTIVHGKARGVDSIVHKFCESNDVDVKPYPARWAGPCDFESGMCQPGHRRQRHDGSEFCPTAGIRRNQLMLDREEPDVCVGLVDKPLSLCRGTSDMVKRAELAEVPLLCLAVVPTLRVLVARFDPPLVIDSRAE